MPWRGRSAGRQLIAKPLDGWGRHCLNAIAINLIFIATVIGLSLLMSRLAGLSWGVSFLIAPAAVAGLWWLLGRQIGNKKLTRYDFEHQFKGLLILRENGGWVDIKHRSSPFCLRAYRESGEEIAAEILISIPRESWAHTEFSSLLAMLDKQELEHVVERDELLHESSLVEIRVSVGDIYKPDAGASPARAVHLVLDTFGLAPNELFEVRLEGVGSWRWKEHRNRIAEG